MHLPSPVGSAGCHSWRSLPVPLSQKFAPSFSRLHERLSQSCMGTHEMIVGAPPLQMGQQLRRLLSCRPGPACERGHAMSNCQIHPFNERRV